MIKIFKRFLTGADQLPPSQPVKAAAEGPHDWVHLRPETRAARTRLAKLLCWHASPDDEHLTDEEAIMAAINRYLAFRGRPLLDPNE